MNIDVNEIVNSSNQSEFTELDNTYLLVKQLACGEFSKIKLAIVLNTNKLVVIKILKKEYFPKFTTVKNSSSTHEAVMLQNVKHKNIISLIDTNRGLLKKRDGRSRVVDYIVLDYAENGELYDCILNAKEALSERYSRYIFLQLLDGLEACHNSGISHRNIKAGNILLTSDWSIKISDFHFAALFGNELQENTGARHYSPPEILSHRPYIGSCADIFSVGVLLFFIVTKEFPFNKAVLYDSLYRHFALYDYESYWATMETRIIPVSNDFKSLINLLLAYNPAQRPSIYEIRSHPWVTSTDLPSTDDFRKKFSTIRQIMEIKKNLTVNEQIKKKTRGLNNIGKVFRSSESVDISPSFTSITGLKKFIDIGYPYLIHVNDRNPLTIMNGIVWFFETEKQIEKNITYYGSQAKITVTLNIKTEMPLLCEDTENITDFDGIYKDGLSNDIGTTDEENLIINIQLKEGEKENYIIEFTKVKGDKCEFVNVFNDFVKYIESNKK